VLALQKLAQDARTNGWVWVDGQIESAVYQASMRARGPESRVAVAMAVGDHQLGQHAVGASAGHQIDDAVPRWRTSA